jgi:hypothetical protein
MVPTFYPSTPDRARAGSVSVAAAEVANGVVIRMLDAPAFVLSGVVVSRGGSPVGGAVVMVVSERPADFPVWGLRCVTTDARGRFAVATLTTGPYNVTAARPGSGTAAGCRPGSSPVYREDSTVQIRIEMTGPREDVRLVVRD